MWLYTDLLQALKGERLSSVFSPDGTSTSASAASHCGVIVVAQCGNSTFFIVSKGTNGTMLSCTNGSVGCW